MEIRPLSSHTGAEVLGIDLTQPVSDSDRAAMNRAFVERSVLVVRDQALTPPQVVEAVGLFGMIFPQQNTKFAIPDCPQIHYVSNEDRFPDGSRYIPGDGWHTDHSNAARPPKATVLHAVRLPDQGGDTQYANMAAAYAALPSATRERLAPLMGIHVYQSSHSARKLMGLNETDKERVPNAVLHPLVRTHPETGRNCLYLGRRVKAYVVGLPLEESEALLDELWTHAAQPQFAWHHEWQPGDIVMWDNRCVMHRRDPFDAAARRILHRVVIKGTRPYRTPGVLPPHPRGH